jgi:hypothetical protein
LIPIATGTVPKDWETRRMIMRWVLRIVFIAACMAMSVPSHAQDDVTPIIGYVLTEPRIAYMSDGKYCVNYELVIANATKSGYSLEEIRVVDPSRSDYFVRTLKADEIVRQIYIPGEDKPASKIPSGKSGYIRINLTFDSKDAIPQELEHIITASADTPLPLVPQPAIGRIGRTKVSSGPAVVIGPPLRGTKWAACVVGADGYHRNTVMPIGGTWVAPERWAVDWIQLGEGDKLLTGAIEKNESYPQYGREIIAVADGSIETVRDGMPDIPAGKAPQMKTLNDAAGNYIVQDIGGGFYALYAHLQPGSLKVKKGDAVKKGQAIALLGNSGNTTGPHLHFHVIHGKSPLGSDGVPYVIDSFAVRGTALSKDGLQSELERGEVVTVKAAKDDGPRSMKMPADLSIVDFKK